MTAVHTPPRVGVWRRFEVYVPIEHRRDPAAYIAGLGPSSWNNLGTTAGPNELWPAGLTIPEDLSLRRPSLVVQDDDPASPYWFQRENDRLHNGTYKYLPWHSASWNNVGRDHIAHISVKDPTMVAFTENAAKGCRDIQLALRPTKYLQRFFGDTLSEKQIAEIVAEFVNPSSITVYFTTTAEDATEVYLNGPSSCMSGPAEDICPTLPCHPAAVYADGDLSVAYTKDRDGNINSRAVVWQAEKRFVRVYPTKNTNEPLARALEAQGYTRVDGWEDALVPAIPCDHGYVTPYLDGDADHGCLETIDGKHYLRIGSGHYDMQNTHGNTDDWNHEEDDDRPECGWCDNTEGELYSVYVLDRRYPGSWCYYCCRQDATECGYDGNRYADLYHSFVDIRGYASSVVSHNVEHTGAQYCEESEEYFMPDEGGCSDECSSCHPPVADNDNSLEQELEVA